MKGLWPWIISILPVTLSAQSGDLPFQAGAENAGIGGVQASSVNVWASHHNPGLLPWLEHSCLALGSENRFLLKELGSHGLAASIPVKNNAFGLSLVTHGYQLFRRSRLGLSYGLKLNEQFSAGVSLNYDRLLIAQNLANDGVLTASIGFAAKIEDDLVIGAYVFNPLNSGFRTIADEKLPVILAISANYAFSDKFNSAVEVEKSSYFQPVIKLGFDYKAHQMFSFRAGVKTYPQSLSFGFGFDKDNLKIDMAAWIHPILGVSPNLSLQYEFNK